MEFLYILLGIIIGIILYKIYLSKIIVSGKIEVDHKSGLCRVFVGNDKLQNPKIRAVWFIVEHDANIDISREEQGL